MAARAGATTKLSVSVRNDDLAVLKARAKRIDDDRPPTNRRRKGRK